MSAHTTCCPPLIIPTARPWPARWGEALQLLARNWWQAWREHARRRAEWRVLQQLSDSTLRDIGLADRQLEPRVTLGMLDHERGRWG